MGTGRKPKNQTGFNDGSSEAGWSEHSEIHIPNREIASSAKPNPNSIPGSMPEGSIGVGWMQEHSDSLPGSMTEGSHGAPLLDAT